MSTKDKTIQNEVIKSCIKNISTREVDFREFSERMMELKFNSEQATIVWNVFNSQPDMKNIVALEGFMRI